MAGNIESSNIEAKKLEFFWGPVPTYFWVISAVNGVITLVCNGLVIFIVLKRDRLFRNPTNWLLLSLALSDLTVGIIMIPSLFICYFSSIPCNWSVNKKVYDLFLYVSVTNLCFLTMDRYIAVVFPLRYTLLVSRRSTIKLLITAWLLPLFACIAPYVVNVLPISENQKEEAAKVLVAIKLGIFELLPCFIMFLAYMHIFQISKRHARHISSINKSIRRERSSTNQAKWHAKSTIRVFCVVVPLFVICWTMASWREICSVFRVCSVPATAVHVSRLLLKGHSMIDPIVYALKVGEIFNLTLVPYGNAEERRSGDKWVFECQHGPKECQGNLIETCAIALLKNISVSFPFIHCFEENTEKSEDPQPAEIAEKCAKSLGIDYSPIETCVSGPQGNSLEHQMAVKTNALKPQHQYVPWVTLNGKHTEKLQREAENNLLKLVCKYYTGPKPSACEQQQIGRCYKNEKHIHI